MPGSFRLAALAAALASLGVPAAGAEAPSRPGAEDDFRRGFAAARAKGALVLVDVWAPW
jgi:hypothetical protein